MLTNEASNAIFDRILADQATEADIAKLRDELQRGKFNIEIESVTAGDFHLGDRIYNGIDAETLRRILREIRDSRADIETVKQAVREVLQSLKPPLPSLEEQRKAVCQFLRSVEERFNAVELLHRRGETIALKDQYIPIQVTLEKQREVSSAGRYLGYLESEAELQRAYALKRENEENKREQVDWQEAKKQHQRIMVLADPGMGKTTLLRMEARTIAHQERQGLEEGGKTLETVILPVWIRLSNLAEVVQQATDTVLEAILKLVKADCDDRVFANLQPLLKEKLTTGKCLLLLDALDEVPRILRDRLSENLNNFARMYSCPIVCTSRIVGYTALLKGATEVEIVPFIQKQTELYIETWFTNAAGYLEDESVSATALIRELRNKPQICGLAQNPLLLSLICSLYQTHGLTLPARRCQVYEEAVELMLSEWSRSSRKQAGAKLQAKTRLLEYLAYQFTCDGIEIFSADQLYIKLSEYLEDSSIPLIFRKFETDDPIDELLSEDGILQQLSEKSYLFLHRTFQEYFTACYLRRAGALGIQLAKAYLWNYEWHETISLMAGLMKEPIDLIQVIVTEKDDIFRTQLLLAGRCIAECAENISSSITSIAGNPISEIYQLWIQHPGADFIQSVVIIIGKAHPNSFIDFLKFLKHETFGVRWSDAVWLLGQIGSTETASALITALTDEDISVRARAAEALGQIGSAEAVPALITALTDETKWVREQAAEALGQIGSAEAVPALITALTDEDISVAFNAAEALRQIGSVEAVSAIVANFRDRSCDWLLMEVLERMGNTEAVSALITALTDEDYWVRARAAKALGQIGSAEAVPSLITTLTEAEALGQIGSAEAVSALITTSFRDETKWVRARAAEALGQIGSAEAVSALITSFRDKSYGNGLRRKAAEILGQIGSAEAVSALITALTDEDRLHRSKAAEILGQIGSTEAVSALITALKDEDPRAAAKALGQIGSAEAVSALITALTDEDYWVREQAAEALGQIGSAEAVSALITALTDETKRVRKKAAQALRRIGSAEAVSALITAFTDETKWDKLEAAEILGRIGSAEAVPALIAALTDEYRWHRSEAAEILGQIGSTKAVPALITALTDEDHRVREQAAEALGQIGSAEAVSALITALSGEDHRVREQAAEALGQIGSAEAVPALITALSGEDHRVREQAAEALGRIGSAEAVSALILALSDGDSEIKWRAAEILGRIGNRYPKEVLGQVVHHPDIDIYQTYVFLLARRLAIQISRKGGDCVPVYRERVKSLA